ncbi:MAG: hypothetical protein OXN89_10810 [Bryobacterales bacterium]|nr:hypothetical protein [Bryobacterales bacterium]
MPRFWLLESASARELNGYGTDLGPERAASVDAIVATLARCVDPDGSAVEETVAGFASDDG